MYLNETGKLVILVYKCRNIEDFSRLVLIWENFVYKKAMFACKMNKDNAKELVVNVFKSIWNSICNGEFSYPIDRWLYWYIIKKTTPKDINRIQ